MLPLQAGGETLGPVVEDDSSGLDGAQRARRLRRRLEELELELSQVERLERRKRDLYAETNRLLHFRAARHRLDAEAYALKATELRETMERVRSAIAQIEAG